MPKILDVYDDPTGEILKRAGLTLGVIPPFIKQAEHLDHQKRDRLPDDIFALVLVGEGEKRRKFACVDKGNTALNVIYLLHQAAELPRNLTKVAAANLQTACTWHRLMEPVQLTKLAVGPQPDRPLIPTREKIASTLQPYLFTSAVGHVPPPQEETNHQHFCLPDDGGKYPIDTEEQVKEASAYFDRYCEEFEPFDRHLYCTKLASRADTLGVSVSDRVRDYGSKTYADPGHVKCAVAARMKFFAKEAPEQGLLQAMMEKYAQVKPEYMATALEQFDREHRIDRAWDATVIDPYASIFAREKTAAWSWQDGEQSINETELTKIAQEQNRLEQAFGKEAALGLKDDPIGIFDSLPLPQKRVIASMAHGG